jgi:hypothetical protein
MTNLLLFFGTFAAVKGVLYVVAKGRNRLDSRRRGSDSGGAKAGRVSDGSSGSGGGIRDEWADLTPVNP